ncbi:GDSL-type esterase/lipase family protein [Streptomyces sp. NPDC097619]|uniref:GDSL-type esterase/lipase family protein n=1 Tax=Streptomyces sp. NPDC097619 TaxID=3157228 RepID=UPI00332ED99C
MPARRPRNRRPHRTGPRPPITPSAGTAAAPHTDPRTDPQADARTDPHTGRRGTPRTTPRTARATTAATAAATAALVLVTGCAGGGSAPEPGRSAPRDAPAGPVDDGGPVTPSWIATWSASPVGAEPDTALRGHAGRTFRNVVHTTVGGTRVRITLSNLFGESPLTVSRATVGRAAGADGSVSRAASGNRSLAAAEPGSLVRLTFGGSGTVTIPPGDEVTSDPAELTVPADADMLVSTYAPRSPAGEPGGPVTRHPSARQTSYAADGDATRDESGTRFTDSVKSWRQLVAMDVFTDRAVGAVVAFGSSLTDGMTSTTDTNRRWTDFLAGRLRGTGKPRLSVVNAGVSGNRLLRDGTGPRALDRFERDVLGRAGVKIVVIQLGMNDILKSPRETEPDRITDALRKLRDQAHAHGIRVIGTTLPPFRGHKAYTEGRDSVRRSVNARLREGDVFDETVDFDRILRDPESPSRLRSDYDSGDHLHLTDEGYAAIGRMFDVALLR